MLRLRSQGNTIEEIAQELNRNERTVSNQLKKATVLSTRAMIIEDAFREHSRDLLDLLTTLEGQVNDVTNKGPLGILRGGMRGTEFPSQLESGSYGGDKGPEGICRWEGRDGRITKFWLDVEEDRLFKYLRQHLQGESLWRLYKKWKESFRQSLETFNDWEQKNIGGDIKSVNEILTPIAKSYDNLMKELVIIQQKHILPGKCDCCPDNQP
jgi:predicted transcriptional regulator